MALLDSSSASRNRNRANSGSSMDRVLASRAGVTRSGGARRNAETDKLRRDWLNQRSQDNARNNRTQREEQTEGLRRRKTDRTVIGLLEDISDKLDRVGRNNDNSLGNIIAGGLLGRLLGRFGIGGGKGLRRGPDGRWRDARGRFARGPDRNFFGRQVDKLGNSRLARAAGGGLERFSKTGIGRGLSGAGRFLGRNAGRLARSPLGRIAGSGLRIGGNVLGKVALPITAAMAVVNGVSGMNRADDILGRNTDLKTKAAVGVAEAVNGALLGLPDLISKRLFGQGFSKLMVDGIDDVKRKIHDSVIGAITNVKNFIGESIGKVGDLIGKGVQDFANYMKEVEGAGTELAAAVKSGDIVGSGKALAKLGKLLFKGAAAPAAAAANLASRGATVVAQGAQRAGSYVAEKAASIGKGAASIIGKGVGAVSAMFESRGGAGTVSSGKGDHGGVSYGKFQLASKNGAVQNYLRQSKYGAEFNGLAPGSKAFNDKWKEIAKRDPKGFEEDQHNFIAKTHFDPQMRKLAKGGIDLSKRGRAVQEAVFSTSVQYGAGTNVIQKALAGKDASKMSDAEIVAAIQDYKAATVNQRFKSSSENVRAGVQSRIAKEKAILTSMANDPNGNKIQVASSMAEAKAVASDKKATAVTRGATTASTPTVTNNVVPFPRASSVQTEHGPLIEKLPEPKPAAEEVSKPQTANANIDTKTQGKAASNAPNSRSSGAGGLPAVNDVADRPRIDLQAIATTLSHR